MQREAFIIETVDWLNRRVAPEGVTVDADTPLFEEGVVSSLGILRLIAWTEKAIGREIQDREIRMDRFHTVRVIADHFLTVRDFVAERDSVAERLPAERGCAAERFADGRAGCTACGRCARRAA